MICKQCGAQINEGTKFCPSCGTSQEQNVQNATLKESFARVEMSNLKAADEIEYTIYGDDMQLVETLLDPGESVIAEAGAMAYMDSCITMHTVFGDGSNANENKGFMGKLASAGKRALAGESLFMTVFTNDGNQPATVAFAAPYPGKIIPVELREFNHSVICQKEAFLCAAKGISVDIYIQKKLGVGLFGGEGFIMERLVGDGLIFVHAGGTIIKKELVAGQTLKVDTGCIVAMDESIDFNIEVQNDIKNGFLGGEGLFLANLTGPGTVWLQSLPFSRMADKVIAASSMNTGESSMINNPVGEVAGGLGKALGGILKF